MFCLLLMLFALLLVNQSAFAAGIRLQPSSDRVSPGEIFYVDVYAENVPIDDGLGAVQFRLNVSTSDNGQVTGVNDLNLAGDASVYVATPLLMSSPTSSRSGLGEFFLNSQGGSGILVLENETLASGEGQYTFAHTHGATLSTGTGTVARFAMKVGSLVGAEKISIALTDVMLLDGGLAFPLDYNLGTEVSLRCSASVPELVGLTLTDAQSALTAAQLVLGDVYEVSASGGPLYGQVLEQSKPSGSYAECESAINIAINEPPVDVTALNAVDVAGDDTGKALLNWTASVSADASGYRIYADNLLLETVSDPQTTNVEIDDLPIGLEQILRLVTYDNVGNESAGVLVMVVALDDVAPVIGFDGVVDGGYYDASVHPQMTLVENNVASQIALLNEAQYEWSLIDNDGLYNLTVTVTDVADNSTTELVNFTVDQTPPQLSVTNLADGGFYNEITTPDIQIDDLGLEDGLTIITLDGQPYINGTPIAAEGDYTLHISATDKAQQTAELTVQFTIDLTAPTITVTGVTDDSHAQQDLLPLITIADTYLLESAITLNGQPFISGTAIRDEGTYELVVSATDKAGNQNSETVRFVIDKTAPIVAIGAVTDGSFYNADTTPVIGVAELYLQSQSITLNGQPYTSGTVIGDEGTYELVVSATDRAGNQSVETITFTIDTTAPAITINGVTEGSFYNTDVTPVIDVVELNLQSQTITLNGQPFVSATTLIKEGAYRLTVDVVDKAENRSTDELTFVIDKTAPESSAEWSQPNVEATNGLFVTGQTTASLFATDPGVSPSSVSKIEFSLDAGQAATYSGPVALVDLAEGAHALVYSATDSAGNEELAREALFTVDNTPPVTVLSKEGNVFETDNAYVTSATKFILEATDSYSGVGRTEYRIDDGEWTLYEPITVAEQGAHTVSFRSVDSLNHQEQVQVHPILVDNLPPVSIVTVGAPRYTREDVLFVSSVTAFSLDAEDADSGLASISYRVDGGDWMVFEQPFSVSGEGKHQIEYRAIDNLGNVQTVQTLEVEVDDSAPVTDSTVTNPQFDSGEKLYVNGATSILLNVTENGAGVASIEYQLDASNWQLYEASIALSALDEGAHTVSIRSADNLGHRETAQQLLLTIDNSAPVSGVELSEPNYQSVETLYVDATTEFTLVSLDGSSGVERVDYRIDDGEWRLYQQPITVIGEGAHRIDYRGVDKLGTVEASNLIEFVLDATAPVSSINIGAQQYTDADGTLYIDPACPISISAADNSSSVNHTEYRVDGGDWLVYSDTIYLAESGQHLIEYLSRDQLDHAEAINQISMTVDAAEPVTEISAGDPQFTGADGKLYVSGQTAFTLSAIDEYSGVASTAYQVDNNAWSEYLTPFTVADEGAHQVLYRSFDYLEHQEADKSLELIVDNTAPVTDVSFEGISYLVGEQVILVSTATVTLTARDTFSGVLEIYYRFGAESSWSQYGGSIGLDNIEPGPQQIQFYSVDNLGQVETEQTVELILLDVAVETEVLTVPRVLVWTEEEKANGKSQPSYTSADVQTLVAQAFSGQNIFYELVTDKDLFQAKVRSGMFNTIMIVDQKTPMNSGFRRELREAVYRGDGLLVAQWGNSVHPIMQEVFGVDFTGSLPMVEGERAAQIYPSPLSENLNTLVYGRVLKTRLDGGQLAGVVLGESQCLGIKGLDIQIPADLLDGDRLTVSLSVPNGKKTTVIDEEQTTVSLAQQSRVDNSSGNLSIESLTVDAINLRVAASLDYLGQAYSLTTQIYHTDGTMTELGPYALLSDCSDNPATGIDYGGYEFTNVKEDRVNVSEDVPAIVLNDYGFGKAVFIAYDLMASAMAGNSTEQADILKNAASHLMSDVAGPRAGGVALMQTHLSVAGDSVDVLAEETLGDGMIHEKLFGLDTDPLSFQFTLADGGAATYNYFVRFADQAGIYSKETTLSLLTDGFEVPFGVYPYDVVISQDLNTLYIDAISWIDMQLIVHPEESVSLQKMHADLVAVHSIAVNCQSDTDSKLDSVTSLIDSSIQLGFDNSHIRQVLGGYLRLLQIEWSQF
jgi:hypothetical protein